MLERPLTEHRPHNPGKIKWPGVCAGLEFVADGESPRIPRVWQYKWAVCQNKTKNTATDWAAVKVTRKKYFCILRSALKLKLQLC